jgi:uncharacterized protein YqgC (DUF456 family)
MSLSIIWLVTILLLSVGLIGTIIPALPGIALTYVGILFYSFMTDFRGISPSTVIIFGIITAIAFLAGHMGSVIGSRAGGGKTWSVVGTFFGAIIGLFTFGPIGLFVGAFFGALGGGMIEGATHHQAFKIATFSTIGVLGGAIVQFFLALSMTIAFLWVVLI